MTDMDKGQFLASPSASAIPRNHKGLWSQVLSGSLTLLSSSGLVGVMNLVFNIATARMLGPTGFGHATVVYTMLMLMSAVTLAFQIVCAKLVANHESPSEKLAIYTGLHRRAWGVGLSICVILFITRVGVASYLNLPSPTLVVWLAVATAFYIPLGTRRGGIQGTYSFRLLALNLVLEGTVRLGGALLLIRLGMGVTGAVLAGVAAVIIAYLSAIPVRLHGVSAGPAVVPSFREGLQAIVFFAGQVIINNSDIVLVKHFFPSEEAGLYAAVALVGRVVNMCVWSVVSTMFPLSAGMRSKERDGGVVLLTSLLLVVLILGFLILGVWMVPNFFWRVLFGSQFDLVGYGSISSLLTLYAITSGVYSLSSVIIAYEMSRKIANTSWVQLAAAGMLVAGIYLRHNSLYQVIAVQLGLMTGLLMVVLFPFFRTMVNVTKWHGIPDAFPRIQKRSAVSEENIVAEFLKNEFHHPEFDEYRDKFASLVLKADTTNSDENALRRALLFLRRGAMWRELPDDTRWFEVELTRRDLDRVRVFPRANWQEIAQGSFYLTDIVERIRAESDNHEGDEFYGKLQLLSTKVQETGVNPTILLIGADERKPLTVLDGNHRITAAMLVGPATALKQFRFLCGFSPRMTECCWYQTNVTTLWRYAKNLLRYMSYDPESDIGRFLERS